MNNETTKLTTWDYIWCSADLVLALVGLVYVILSGMIYFSQEPAYDDYEYIDGDPPGWTTLETYAPRVYLQTLEAKLDLLYSKLSEKDRCRFEYENGVYPDNDANTWLKRCEKYLEKTPEAYKIP